VPSLLVSVRSVEDAKAAVLGGASVIDIKEPSRGPLGRADSSVWERIRDVVPPHYPVSVALGELREWRDARFAEPGCLDRFQFQKIGLADAGPHWRAEWARLRKNLAGNSWIAVIYSDWKEAKAPAPHEIIAEALALDGCSGILIDSWDKSKPGSLDESWLPWLMQARSGGLTIALAGRLNEAEIKRLAGLEPDWFAVRSAACHGGERLNPVDADRVERLARLVASLAVR